ncbi:MAG: chemotaxis protein CheW [Kofleriaceae bacterium]|nr:chemotaxis protein CheW [Kofleriaceae bacterium]
MRRRELAVSDAVQYLSFYVGTEAYGFELLEAREIVACTSITRVPSLPVTVRGVVNVRGTVIPVVDLAVMFGQPEQPLTGWSCIVILALPASLGEMGQIGLLVDTVASVIELGPGDIAPPPSVGSRIRSPYVRGTGKAGERLVLLLDLARIFERIEIDPATLLEELSEEATS